MADTADAIKEGAAALPAVSQYFPVVISLILLVGGGWLVKNFMDAEVAALKAIETHLGDLEGDFRASGVELGHTKQKRLAAQAAASSGGP